MLLGKNHDAIDYYNIKIIELEELASKDYNTIVETWMKCHTKSLVKKLGIDEMKDLLNSPISNGGEDAETTGLSQLYALLVPSNVRKALGEESEFFTGTGIVTFKSIAS